MTGLDREEVGRHAESGEGVQVQDDSVDVLYIVGAGRSGSTVLERIIVQERGFTAAGEVCYLHRRGHELDELCSCGRRFSDCPFWREVVGETFDSPAEFDWFAAEQAWFCRLRRLPQLRFARLRSPEFRRRLARFHDMQSRLFRALRAAGQSDVVVDSSKFVPYGYLLAANPGVKVHAIHLIRDARGVAFSWQRVKDRPEANDLNPQMLRIPAAMAARIWLMDNVLAGGLRRHVRDARLLRYEDYCGDESRVGATLVAVGLPAGKEAGTNTVSSSSAKAIPHPSGTFHSVSGNPMRMDRAQTRLVPDEEWRGALAPRDRMLITLLTAPVLLRYRYIPHRARRGAPADQAVR